MISSLQPALRGSNEDLVTPMNGGGAGVAGDQPRAGFLPASYSGAIAFAAIKLTSDTDPTGIFLEVSGGESLIRLIRPGDKLFDSLVTHVDLGRFALNDRLQVAFSYTLADGRSGIAIASYNGER